MDKNRTIAQSSIDANSKKLLEWEADAVVYKEKWSSLESLEKQIKKATNKKFQVLTDEVSQEVRDEVKKEVKKEIRDELLQEVRTIQKMAANSISEGLGQIRTQMVEEVKTQQKTQPPDSEVVRSAELKGQAFPKRHNVAIFGLPEGNTQENDSLLATTFFDERMGLKDLSIKTVYRLGNSPRRGKMPRPLVVQFYQIKDKWAVWKRKSSIKYVPNCPIWLQEDLPKQLWEVNRILQSIAKTAKAFPDRFSGIKVKDYQLTINGNKYDAKHTHLLPPELRPWAVYAPRTSEAIVFFTRHSPLSNHFPCKFSVENQEYSCIEQYLAHKRALLVDNPDLAQSALQSSNPADHKVILNTLFDASREKWLEEAPHLILTAARAKFEQNELLANFLVETHPLRIGEASRNIDRNILNTAKWSKQGNLLGKTSLKSETNSSSWRGTPELTRSSL